jgi:hypothetical protein
MRAKVYKVEVEGDDVTIFAELRPGVESQRTHYHSKGKQNVDSYVWRRHHPNADTWQQSGRVDF